jgi:hypothetical protein
LIVRPSNNLLTTLGVPDELWNISHLDATHPNALKTADTTAGTMPSSMKEGMKQSFEDMLKFLSKGDVQVLIAVPNLLASLRAAVDR